MAFDSDEDDCDRVSSYADLTAFVEQLRRDLRDRPEEWENTTLDNYLEAMHAWLVDSHKYHQLHGDHSFDNGGFKFIANMLAAAAIYE